MLQLNIDFSFLDILFGYCCKQRHALNLIILLYKRHIYKQKLQNRLPSVAGVKKEILYYMKIEEYTYKKNYQISILK